MLGKTAKARLRSDPTSRDSRKGPTRSASLPSVTVRAFPVATE